MKEDDKHLTPRSMMDLMIRMALILYLSFLCLEVFAPFALIMLWGLIIAIVLFPVHQKLAEKMNGKQGRAASVLVLTGCVLIGGPVFSLGMELVDHIQGVHQLYEAGEFQVPPPKEKVKEIPIVGPKVYQAWEVASDDLKQFLIDYKEPLTNISKKLVASAGGAFSSVAMFVGALVIAGFMKAFGVGGNQAMLKIAKRISGEDRGEKLTTLSVMTIRSVTTGVIGVAFIQALLVGIGLLLAGIPTAAIIALIVMFIGILQLPAVIVVLPIIVYIWSTGDGSTMGNVFFTVYFIIAALSDNVLKPMLLGRGVDAPMPVILIGALGGMMASGLIGLFLGATLLAVAYRIFTDWVDNP